MSSLKETIASLQNYYVNGVEGESNTVTKVILPLLGAGGYTAEHFQLEKQTKGKGIVDIALLPDTKHAWYLEAKAWNISLRDDQVAQTLSYVNNDGKRFAILSNGQEWRLYDNSVQGVAHEKFLKSVHLRDQDEMETFFGST